MLNDSRDQREVRGARLQDSAATRRAPQSKSKTPKVNERPRTPLPPWRDWLDCKNHRVVALTPRISTARRLLQPRAPLASAKRAACFSQACPWLDYEKRIDIVLTPRTCRFLHERRLASAKRGLGLITNKHNATVFTPLTCRARRLPEPSVPLA
jgi:hypothetical protein